MTATIFSKNNCPNCLFTKREFEKNNIEYTEINLEENPELLEDLRNEGFMAAPIVKLSTGESWAGYAPKKIRSLATAQA